MTKTTILVDIIIALNVTLIIFDNKGNDAWTEMDEYQEMQEEDRIERQIESRLEMASSRECGAYQIKGMEVYQVADCCCGAG